MAPVVNRPDSDGRWCAVATAGTGAVGRHAVRYGTPWDGVARCGAPVRCAEAVRLRAHGPVRPSGRQPFTAPCITPPTICLPNSVNASSSGRVPSRAPAMITDSSGM